MKEFVISDNDAGQRLDRFTAKAVPLLPTSLAQKYMRTKRIKVGGKRSSRDYRLIKGDVVQMYVSDEFFEASAKSDDWAHLKFANAALDIIFEDENIMLVSKPAGLLCHDGRLGHISPNSARGNVAEARPVDTLILRIQAYLYKSEKWHPGDSHSFVPALCNRIDRNTSGIVIAAKNAQALRIICEKLMLGEIDKRYLAVVHGIPSPESATLEGYIFKDAVKNRVYVSKNSKPGSKTAIMEYKTLETARHEAGDLALLECRLITGRTHQIRAQLASINHPLLGDDKYGRGDLNKRFGKTKQALCSYKVTFAFKTDGGMLSYLQGRTFEIKNIPFLEDSPLDTFLR